MSSFADELSGGRSRVFEHLYDYWKEAPGLVAANHKLLAGLNRAHFLHIQILLATLIANYCIFAELARVIGRDKLRAMFFGPVPTKRPRVQAPMGLARPPSGVMPRARNPIK
ncbi:hypothetical protein PQR34_48015 [Paraburkholderia sediminicola]|uniref:hypothetical protein n=1 Tax=Paraburkholderia sediminicola TaxID=458836 RepID=UPI0038BCB16A